MRIISVYRPAYRGQPFRSFKGDKETNLQCESACVISITGGSKMVLSTRLVYFLLIFTSKDLLNRFIADIYVLNVESSSLADWVTFRLKTIAPFVLLFLT